MGCVCVCAATLALWREGGGLKCARLGVRKGWLMTQIDGMPFSEELFKATKSTGFLTMTVTFFKGLCEGRRVRVRTSDEEWRDGVIERKNGSWLQVMAYGELLPVRSGYADVRP